MLRGVVETATVETNRENATPGWRAESGCREYPTRWWFAGDHRETLLARSICAACPVEGACLDFALTRPDILGIWAATTAAERAATRRRRAAPDPPSQDSLPVPIEARVVDAADLLTPAEAARKLGVTPNTVTRWSRAGKLSAIQTMGGHRRFRRAEIDRLSRPATRG